MLDKTTKSLEEIIKNTEMDQNSVNVHQNKERKKISFFLRKKIF